MLLPNLEHFNFPIMTELIVKLDIIIKDVDLCVVSIVFAHLDSLIQSVKSILIFSEKLPPSHPRSLTISMSFIFSMLISICLFYFAIIISLMEYKLHEPMDFVVHQVAFPEPSSIWQVVGLHVC